MISFEEKLNDRMSVVTVAGSFSGNTTTLSGGIVGIRVRPASPATRYDVRIVDKDDFVIFSRKGIRGEWVEDFVAPIAVRGIVTCSILNATADEAFRFKLMWDNS